MRRWFVFLIAVKEDIEAFLYLWIYHPIDRSINRLTEGLFDHWLLPDYSQICNPLGESLQTKNPEEIEKPFYPADAPGELRW